MKNIEWGTETDKKLEQIAMDADFALEQRGGLETRRNDGEDFIELSVWASGKCSARLTSWARRKSNRRLSPPAAYGRLRVVEGHFLRKGRLTWKRSTTLPTART